MMTRVNGRFRGMSRPTRRVAVAASFVAVMFAGGVATGMTGNDSDGRDGQTQPGAPVDQPAPTPIDTDAGRGGAGVGKAPKTAVLETSSAVEGGSTSSAAPADNGRGGVDPASGPQPVVQALAAESAVSLDAGSFDTDSGLAPEPTANGNGKSKATRAAESTPSAPVDQDVPGAPTGGPPGDDLPPNDADG